MGWVFLVNVAGVGLSQGRVCRGVGLSQGCVCRWGAFVAGVGLSWGGFVLGRVCRGEGLSGVGLSRGGFVWGGFVGVPYSILSEMKYKQGGLVYWHLG